MTTVTPHLTPGLLFNNKQLPPSWAVARVAFICFAPFSAGFEPYVVEVSSERYFLHSPLGEAGNQIPASLLTHKDSLQLKDLFKQHPQIRLCISGHLHMQEELTYLGIKYLCNGSIVGRRWIGPFQEFEPIITILDFYEDGRTQHYWYDYTKTAR